MVRFGGMSALFFTDQEICDFSSVMTSDTKTYAKYFAEMLNRGNLMPPAQFEGIFVSAAHTKADIEKTIADNLAALKALA